MNTRFHIFYSYMLNQKPKLQGYYSGADCFVIYPESGGMVTLSNSPASIILSDLFIKGPLHVPSADDHVSITGCYIWEADYGT